MQFDGPAATVSYTERTLRIVAKEGSVDVDNETVSAALSVTSTILDNKDSFHCLWDLRHCPVPSARTVLHVTRWALRNRSKLLTFNTRLAIVLPSRRPIITLVRAVLSTFGPACPTLVSDSRTAADEFLASPTATPSPPLQRTPPPLAAPRSLDPSPCSQPTLAQ